MRRRLKRDYLAHEMVNVLKDEHSLGFYRRVAETVPEHKIFEALSLVKIAAREDRIRVNRGAAFTSIMAAGIKGGGAIAVRIMLACLISAIITSVCIWAFQLWWRATYKPDYRSSLGAGTSTELASALIALVLLPALAVAIYAIFLRERDY